MVSLFMDPAACGPVNDLKQLGGRLDVDSRARRDGFTSNNQYQAGGPSRQIPQPFQALPQSSGFKISSPSSPTVQQPPGPQPLHAPASGPSTGQGLHPPFTAVGFGFGFENAQPRASSSSASLTPGSGSSGWAGSFQRDHLHPHPHSQAQARTRTRTGERYSQARDERTSGNGWADEHLSRSQHQPFPHQAANQERTRYTDPRAGYLNIPTNLPRIPAFRPRNQPMPIPGPSRTSQPFPFNQGNQVYSNSDLQGSWNYHPHPQTHSGADLGSIFPAPLVQSSAEAKAKAGSDSYADVDRDLAGLRETARLILRDPRVRGEMGDSDVSLDRDRDRERERDRSGEVQGGQVEVDMEVENPFGTSEFFKLMKDLALDPEEIQRGKAEQDEQDERGREGERNVDTEGRGACFFGGFEDDEGEVEQEVDMGRVGFDAYIAELDREAEAEREREYREREKEKLESRWDGPDYDVDLDLDKAIPTVHQPVFDQEGRWVPYHKIREFREKGMDVPRHLREALDLARVRDTVPGQGLGQARGQEQEGEAKESGDMDGFDNDGLVEFYGNPRRSLKRDPFAQSTQAREHAERSLTGGFTSRETDEAMQESEDALERVLGDEKVEQARRDGYYTERRRGEGVGLDGKYLFVSENPYVQEGRSGRRQEMGRMGEVVAGMEMQYQNLLEHEARVLEDPDSSRAWFDLAIKQQELERDDQAIRALLQCISLDPECKEAYLALSVSYTNEGMIREGHSVLERWVDGASESGLARNKGDDADLGRFEAGAPGVHKNQRHEVLTRELMRMARMMPEGDIDADVQVALGVLFNASEEFEKAQDCFRAALFARQDDWMLYNRLGATLANGGKSEEALRYYEQALNLNPGYVRAMFNVGISLIKLARYRQAARYILDAIRLQHADASSNVKSIKSVTSDILWNTLGTTCMHLERHDLMDACTARDLDVLDQEFQEYE